MTEKSWRVPVELQGARLDAFLRRALPHLSRRVLDTAIRENLFLINGRPGRKGNPLKSADSVRFRGDPSWLESAPLAEPLVVPIVYEDDFIIVLDKPAGMATHGFSARDANTLANFLIGRLPLLAGVGTSPWEAGLVHRLDGETSGLVVAAKTRSVFVNLKQQFRRRKIDKWYCALVWGTLERNGSIDYPLAHDSSDRRKMRALVSSTIQKKEIKTWPAQTRYHVLAARERTSLLELEMRTGVTHQLRVHLAALGHPIVGDRLYGAEYAQAFGLERHFLHAKRLRLRHPHDDRWIEFEAGLPPELTAVLKRLKFKT